MHRNQPTRRTLAPHITLYASVLLGLSRISGILDLQYFAVDCSNGSESLWLRIDARSAYTQAPLWLWARRARHYYWALSLFCVCEPVPLQIPPVPAISNCVSDISEGFEWTLPVP